MISIILISALVLVAAFVISYYYAHHQTIEKFKHIPGISQYFHSYIPVPFFKYQVSHTNRQEFLDIFRIVKEYAINGVSRVVTYNRAFIAMSSVESIKHVMIKNAKNYPKPSSKVYEAFDIWGPNVCFYQLLTLFRSSVPMEKFGANIDYCRTLHLVRNTYVFCHKLQITQCWTY
jgi:hypothetical protein